MLIELILSIPACLSDLLVVLKLSTSNFLLHSHTWQSQAHAGQPVNALHAG